MENDSDLNKNILSVRNLSFSFPENDERALNDISIEIKKGSFTFIIGPSGCGKSTLIKILTGLIEPQNGTFTIPEKVSMVFQNGALLPWLDVQNNVAFGLVGTDMEMTEIKKITKKYIDLVGLTGFERKFPRDLSGGQRQRVGIARALAVAPEVLFLDEPFSALDIKTTEELHRDLFKIWKETGITIVMISHSISEAVALGERIILMKKGKIAKEYNIKLPYPRKDNASEFGMQVQEILKEFLR